MAAVPYIHFSGHWSDDEKTCVQSVIDRAEDHLAPSWGATGVEPWNVLVHSARGRRFYTAHRMEHDCVITASTVTQLARRLVQVIWRRRAPRGDSPAS